MVPELLTLVHVGDMHFHCRQLHCSQGITEGNGRVREGAGVQDDADGGTPGCVDGVEKDALMVRLNALSREPVRLGGPSGQFFHISQAGRAILFRFTGAQEIKVGSVDYQDGSAAG